MKYEKLGDEYLLLKELGRGGYAVVYKAKNLRYGYIRAIRVLEAHVENEESKIYQSFLRECRVLLRLGNGCHPNIVRLYQPRHVAGRAFVEMDWIDGVDLRKLIEYYGGKVPVEETLRMAREMGSALSYCHHDIYKVCYDRESDQLEDADDGSALITPEVESRLVDKYRVVHNDIHTGNIMRRADGSYILLDFGLAVDGGSDVVNSSRRQQGAIEFKSPERSEGLTPTPQDDIYSFGCVLYAMLAGHPPFPLKAKGSIISDVEHLRIVNAHKELPPPPIERPDVPQWLVDIAMRCLAKNPADRFADGFALNQEILAHLKEEPAEGKNLEPRIAVLENENRALEQEKKRAEQEKAEMAEFLADLEGNRDTLTREIADLKAQGEQARKEVARLKRRPSWVLLLLLLVVAVALTFFGLRMASGDSHSGEKADSLKLLTADVEALKLQNDSLMRQNDSLATENGILQQSQGADAQQMAQLLKDKADLEAAKAALENDKRNLSNQVASLQAQLIAKQNKINELEKQVKKLQADLKNAPSQARLKELQAEVNRLNSENSNLQRQLQTERNNETKLENRIAELENSLTSAQRQIDILTGKKK